MRIIKQGVLPRDVFVGTCRYCKAEIEADRNELAGKIETCPREHYSFSHVECPCCKKQMTLYPNAK